LRSQTDLPRKEGSLVPAERIEKSILLIRGRGVILDSVLAGLYGVETRVLIQAVKRNLDRFPDDFMFQLAPGDADFLKSQIVISEPEGRAGRRSAGSACGRMTGRGPDDTGVDRGVEIHYNVSVHGKGALMGR
jgi:hypothetical protein